MSNSIHDQTTKISHLLTRDNLYILENKLDEQAYRDSRDLLDRYLRDITSISTCNEGPTTYHSSPQRSRNEDLVIASPRMLPFPYHNDSLFFPTAEHIQYLHSYSTDTSSSSPTTESLLSTLPLTSRSTTPLLDSSSILVPPSPTVHSSTPPHVAQIYNRFYGLSDKSRNNTSGSLLGHQQQPRQQCKMTSSSIYSGSSQRYLGREMSSLSLVIDQSSVSKGGKKGLLDRLPTFHTARSSFSSISSKDITVSEHFSEKDAKRKKSLHWFRLFISKITGSGRTIKKSIRHKLSNKRRGNMNGDDHSSVWYCKYKENPKSITITNIAINSI